MARLTWLADVLRADGLHVAELEGWEGRGRDDIDPQAVICHHTATGPGWSDESVVRLLRDGRSDLPGPLSQLGLRRDGTFDLIAAGRANHNGARTAKYGNDSVGIEAYNDGVGERWPTVQLDAFERGSAAILRHLGLPVSRCVGHKESDPTRKIDPRDVDMNAFRSKVARHLIASPPPLEDDMLDAADKEWLRDLIGEAAGPKRIVDQYGQKGPRRDVWRWAGEGVTLARKNTAEIAALREAVAQLGNGGTIDYRKVQKAAEDAIRATLGAIDE